MKDNYKFNQDPKEPSASDIQKHKNFDNLLQNFQQVPTPKKPWLKIIGIGATAIAAAVVGIYFMFSKPKNDTHFETPLVAAGVVKEPIKDLSKPFTNYEIDNSKGGAITYPSGSVVTVPANAFVRPNGEPATGKVNVQYREFHDAVDIFLSGIPMNYDSLGKKYQLESAGMMEIYANQNGEKLALASDKSLDIALKSNITSDEQQYNIYELDANTKKWTYRTSDRIERLMNTKVVKEDKNEMSQKQVEIDSSFTVDTENTKGKKQYLALQKEITTYENTAPLIPQKPSGKEFVFDINFDGLKYNNNSPKGIGRSLKDKQDDVNDVKKKLYQGTMWKLSNSTEKLPADYGQTQWEDVDISDNGNNAFVLTLKKEDKLIKLNVAPVLIGKNYEKAMAEYKARFDEYEAKLKEKQDKLANLRSNFEAEQKVEREMASKSAKEKAAYYTANGHQSLATEELIKEQVINHFKVATLGLWNCDRPLPEDMLGIKANFKVRKDVTLDNQLAFMASKTRNTVYSFYTHRDVTMVFNPNDEYTIWIVTEENKLAIVKPDEFLAMKKMNIKANQQYNFNMTLSPKPLNSEAEIRAALNI